MNVLTPVVQLNLSRHWTSFLHDSPLHPGLLVLGILSINNVVLEDLHLLSIVIMCCHLLRLFSPNAVCSAWNKAIQLCVQSPFHQ